MKELEKQKIPCLDREIVACCVCGAEPPDVPEFVIQTFPIVRCPRCGVRRVSPRLTPGALRQYYDAGYWKSPDSVMRGYFDYAGDEANIRLTFKRRLQRIQRHTKSAGRWLDVGCAYGFLLLEAQNAGWEVGGVEWSEHAATHAPEAVRARIKVGSLLQADWPENHWDVVSLWDYLEHSQNPKADLEKAAKLLKPGGWLSVIIPDPGSWLARWMGARWEEYKKPQEHLYFWRFRNSCGMIV
jgi:SAM-dependent methyltransferase